MRVLFLFIFISSTFSNQFVNIDISIPIIQEIEILDIRELPLISAEDINRGYIDIEDAVKMRIKSNVDWKLSVLTRKLYLYNDNRVEVSNIKIINQSRIIDLGQAPTILATGLPTSDFEIIVSYRRNLSWDSCPPGSWIIEPEFILEQSE